MAKEEIERALKNPPYSIAIGNLHSKAFDFREAAKRYLSNTDDTKSDELARDSRSKWALFCSSVDSLSHWPNKDCKEELRKELRKIALAELYSILNEFFLVENS